jgi:hypothetical protein
MFLSNGSFVIDVFCILMTVETSFLLVRCSILRGVIFLVVSICLLVCMLVCLCCYDLRIGEELSASAEDQKTIC